MTVLILRRRATGAGPRTGPRTGRRAGEGRGGSRRLLSRGTRCGRGRPLRPRGGSGAWCNGPSRAFRLGANGVRPPSAARTPAPLIAHLSAFCHLLSTCISSSICSCVLYMQLCLTVTPVDCSPPGSSVHGILQARILECATMTSSRGSS